MRPELLNEHLLSLSNDTVAVVDMAEKGKGTPRRCGLLWCVVVQESCVLLPARLHCKCNSSDNNTGRQILVTQVTRPDGTACNGCTSFSFHNSAAKSLLPL